MKIEILGMGCAKCNQLYDNVQKALEKTGRETEVVKVEDIAKITGYDVMVIPALVVDGEVRSAGKVLSAEEIAGIIQKTGV
ncbi:MAG: TM0996/MTH895 family glutaredoxin-like protein [Candidatus Aureabacteria bacterium]|nr:TM0996/MTH895 family glutaredoxin-like protein [Candidatus Auribacterota bacterium]